RKFGFQCGEHSGLEGIIGIGEDDADIRRAPARAQSLGCGVEAEAEFSGGVFDLLGSGLGDVLLPVEYAGGGLDADSGPRSDGGQRRPFVLLRHDHTLEPEDRFVLLRCSAQTTSGMILTADRRNRSPRWAQPRSPTSAMKMAVV